MRGDDRVRTLCAKHLPDVLPPGSGVYNPHAAPFHDVMLQLAGDSEVEVRQAVADSHKKVSGGQRCWLAYSSR